MSPLSLITKLQTVFNVITSSNLYLMILALIVFLTLIFITTNGSNRKQSRRAYILIYLAGFIFLAVQYGNSFLTLLDYAINEVFITYYFPNIVIYILMLLITNIILWKTIFNDRIDKKLKIINSTAFALIVYLFILAIATINKLNLDVFNITELYSSNDVRSIMELSTLIFTFWIVILIIYHLIRRYQYKHNIIEVENFTNYNIIKDFNIKEAYKTTNQKIIIEEPKEEKIDIDSKFTLEEYKLMSKILKEEKDSKEDLDINQGLTELNKLYQSIKD